MEINFMELEKNPLKMYGGANGNKIGILYLNETYMLKFPPKPPNNPLMSYANSCISEYVACNIFKALGLTTQDTLLGRYGDKITVACKDFETDGVILKDFASLKNTIIDSEQNGYGTDLNDILKTIHEQQIISPAKLESFFWEMFIGDALLGNFDRHNGNWGFLVNHNTSEVKIAPIYDCGSCLYPQINENKMMLVVNNSEEIEERIFVYPTSVIQHEGKKLNYFQFLMTTKDEGCLSALRIVSDRINLTKIYFIIDNTPYISDIQKLFLKTMIAARKQYIIDAAMTRLRGCL